MNGLALSQGIGYLLRMVEDATATDVAPAEPWVLRDLGRDSACHIPDNRVWDFYATYSESTGIITSQTAELHQGNCSTSTTIVSDVRYWGYRWYEPKIGRWISRDGLGEAGGINLYEYCGGSPLTMVDPYGLYEAIASYNYWSDVAVSGISDGGVGGYSQAAGASVMQAFIDFWGARTLEKNSSLSGLYSTSDECLGQAWKYGLLAGGQIALSAGGAFGGNNAVHPFYRFVGPGSRTGVGAGTWLARGTIGSVPYGSVANAASKLQIPPVSGVTGVIRVKNVWWRYIAGPRRASGHPAWGAGGGMEYRIGGF